MALISKVKSVAVPTGFGCTLGNKGGVGISFHICTSSFCFITAHLAAHQHAVRRRTTEFHKISCDIGRRLGEGANATSTEDEEEDDTSDLDENEAFQSCPPINPLGELFDFVFWSGDMNYRIHSSREIVDELLERNRHNKLLQMDQLRIMKTYNPIFRGFSEGPVNFRPTYKFDSNSGA